MRHPGISNEPPKRHKPEANTLPAPRIVETQRERRELLLSTISNSPELLATLGVPILAGRGLTPAADKRTV